MTWLEATQRDVGYEICTTRDPHQHLQAGKSGKKNQDATLEQGRSVYTYVSFLAGGVSAAVGPVGCFGD